jgi:galactokinase
VETAIDRLIRASGGKPDLIFGAPGRANLIGEHTDYNGGLVLPVALNLRTFVGGSHTTDGVLRLRSLDESGAVSVDLGNGAGPSEGWGRYATGVVRAALDGGYSLRGFDGLVAGDVPIGAGLSSSAALEVAIARAILEADIEAVDLARMCRRAENVYCGTQSGIMDQLTATAGVADHALLIDCLDETWQTVSFPPELTVLVVDSAVRRSLAASGYNQRRAETERAALALGIATLRTASLHDVESGVLKDPERRRARHVVTENERVRQAAAALVEADTQTLGPLFAESHRSLAEDFEVSTPELDELVSVAVATEGVIAARMTGGGFGGCIVCLAESGRAAAAAERIVTRYGQATAHPARYWISRPASGASAVNF